jgi:CheY-like chemotaxis protein
MPDSPSDPRSPREPATPRAHGLSRESARILVADDEDGALTLMTDMLVYAGFTVIPAHDGVEAIRNARETHPDLALVDVMMPGMDGREVCRNMKAIPTLADVPVVLVSSADEREIDWRGSGAVAFIQKPFNLGELTELIRSHTS